MIKCNLCGHATPCKCEAGLKNSEKAAEDAKKASKKVSKEDKEK